MQTRNTHLDDLSRLFISMTSGAGSVKEEFEKEMRAKLGDFISKDVVSRDEFEIFRELLQDISVKQDDIIARLVALEQAKSEQTSSKQPIKKRATKTSAKASTIAKANKA